MKRFLFIIVSILLTCSSFAQPSHHSVRYEQWFIQLAAFTSVENAVSFQNKIQGKLEGIYAPEREFGNYASIHPHEENYRVLLGPYPTKRDAQTTQVELMKEFSNSMITKFSANVYYNYQYGYQFTWHEIDVNTYKNFLKNSLIALNLEDFVPPSIGNQVSLIAHSEQIDEEIFDIEKAKRLLQAKGFVLLQEIPNSLVINGYEVDGKKNSTEWPHYFYAYYPTENLIVLMGEGEVLISLTVDTGERSLKMPYYTLYSPDRKLRITGSNFDPLGYGRSYVELHEKHKSHYVELMDLGIVSPWFIDTSIYGLAWLSNTEVIVILDEPHPTEKIKYYRVLIDHIK